MTKEEARQIWAPIQARWSPWVKPVLFSFMDGVFSPSRVLSAKINLDWLPGDRRSAVIINLPGTEGVQWGLALAQQHYQPIPLYNALPFPPNTKMTPQSRPVTTVSVEPILAALYQGCATLNQFQLGEDSPPAFLLDADRDIATTDPVSGVFENRSVCFTTDFPSPDFLLANGIREAILVQKDEVITRDLLRVLLGWQESGIHLFKKNPQDKSAPTSITVKPPSILNSIWDRLRIMFGLRRQEFGSFGGTLSAGG